MFGRIAVVALFMTLSACKEDSGSTDAAASPVATVDPRGGLVLADDPYGDHATRLVYLDQGWDAAKALWYYYADQGSVLMPYEVLVHLEQPDDEERVLDAVNLARYRFLTQHPTPNNPDALPIGFARHGDHVGLTCAACHTAQITYRGTAIRVEGAPTLADVMGFISHIRDALAATLADEAKLSRFKSAIGAGGPPLPGGPPHSESAEALLGDSLAWFEDYIAANRSSTVEGFGRIDAVGRIINQVIRFTSAAENGAEPNAPNSFPILWDAPRLDYVQWGGFSANADAGALGRNVGEVVGVFGSVDVMHYETEQEAKKGYPSTVEGNTLVSLEEALYELKSPVWPEETLPPIDRSKAARGAELYATACASCHALLDRDDPDRKATAMITAIDVVGTDPQSANNLISVRAPTGILEGAIASDGSTYGATASGLALLGNLVQGILTAQLPATLRAVANAKRNGIEASEKQGDYHEPTEADPAADLRSYKARPLNGMWASAPYLHNGSVPTLYDLLLPATDRPKRFAVGRTEFDPEKVGYVTDGESPWVHDTSVIGNHNGGHEYGTTLSEDDRWALVEYLKTL